jgi:ADP-ribose pyrophosphatase YjhB (NUDIX family)
MTVTTPMRYCSACGGSLLLRVPAGDHLQRHVCERCGEIHYQNPKMVVGCVATHGEQILLCRRAIEPRRGLWTLPAGFMENGETSAAAAARETHEEACAQVEIGKLFSLVDVPHISQVHLFYLGRLATPAHAAGAESLETALFSENEIPWESIAFRSVNFTLRAFFADRRRGRFVLHTQVLAAPSSAFLVEQVVANGEP